MAVHEKPNRGPLLGSISLHSELELRAGLIAAFETSVHQGIAFAGRMQSAQALALREYRSALRRARAIVKLSAPLLSNRVARQLDSKLKSSYEATSRVREADALSGLLDELDGGRAHAQLQQLRSAMMSARLSRYDDRRIAAGLLTGIVSVRGLPELFERSLAPTVTWELVIDGLALTYRSARKHFQRGRQVPDRSHIHNLRQRMRDLKHQLELIASTGSKRPARLRRRVTRMYRPLARGVHLHTLADDADRFLESRDASRLAGELERLASRCVRKALRRGDDVFELGAGRLARKLTASVAKR